MDKNIAIEKMLQWTEKNSHFLPIDFSSFCNSSDKLLKDFLSISFSYPTLPSYPLHSIYEVYGWKIMGDFL